MAQYPESEYCTFIFPDGRRCRALKMPTRHVCIGHWHHDGQFEQDEASLVELAAVSRTLDSRRGIRKALASVFRLIATDRIPPRKASLLLYNGQLMLMTFATRDAETAEATAKESKELVEANEEIQPIGQLVPVHAGSNGSNGSRD